MPLGLLALAELHRRRPHAEIVLFGDGAAGRRAASRTATLGVARAAPSSRALYAEAAVGLVLSLTNPSLVPTGDARLRPAGASTSRRAEHGRDASASDGPIELAAAEPLALAERSSALLDDPERAAARAAGIALARRAHVAAAAEQVEAALSAVVAG